MTDFDIIERKGIGHPDTIADSLSERLSARLEQEYLKRYNRHMHYNVDKVLVTGGKITGGKMTRPIRIVFAGQYTPIRQIPAILDEIVRDELAFEISNGMRYKIYNMLNPGAHDLTANFNQQKSNDTSFAVGSPETDNDRTVKEIGYTLDNLHTVSPHFGRDNKVMFIQKGNERKAYIALACLNSPRLDYYDEIGKVKHDLETRFQLHVTINNAGPFLTLTGTSLEQGDSGMTGRGNRYNGLITPLRPMTMEAYAGKNNQTHIGKIYQKQAHKHAQETSKHVLLLNKIGHDLGDPEIFEW